MGIENNNLNTDILHLKKALLVDYEYDDYNDEFQLLHYAKKVAKTDDMIISYLIRFLNEYKHEIKKDDIAFVKKYKERFYKDLKINSIVDICFFNCIIYALCFKVIDIKEFKEEEILLNIRFLQIKLKESDNLYDIKFI